jgi:hypothetical protein
MKPAPAFALPIAASIGALLSAPAEAQQSIVGKWAIDRTCGAPLSVIVIEPLGLAGEDFYCEFDNVSRQGETVNWRGKCNFSEAGYEPSAVTAQMRGKRLYYRFAGRGWNGPFDRCPK